MSKVRKICPICKKEYLHWPYEEGRRRFCSVLCRSKSQIGQLPKFIPPKLGENRNCYMCGKKTYINRYRLSINKTGLFYCSNVCRGQHWIGKDSPSYKHGKFTHEYFEKSIHGKRLKFHRWVVENYIGRELTNKEQVHHLDGNKRNNKPQNLYVFATGAEHSRYHILGGKIESNLDELKKA